MTVYGPIFSANRLVAAAEETVRLWWPAYAAEVGRQEGLDTPLTQFRSINPALTVEGRIVDQLPALIVVAPGLSGVPVRHGKTYEATWVLGVGVVVGATSFDTTFRLLQRYCATLRSLLLHHRSMGGVATDMVWIGETYDEEPVEGNADVMAGLVTFDATVQAVTDVSAGPITPPDDPTLETEWPLVEHTVVVTKEA